MLIFLKKNERAEEKIIGLKQILIALVYNYVSRSLFKADRMMFAMHVVRSMFSKQFKENVNNNASLNQNINKDNLSFNFLFF